MRRKLSQVLFNNPALLKELFSMFDFSSREILEIGAGKGAVTEELAKQAKNVVALEIDERFVSLLKSRFNQYNNVKIVQGDVLSYPIEQKTIVGFIPYHIASPIIFKILASNFEEAVLCIQKDLAKRLVAEPNSNDYSRISVMAQSQAEISILVEIPKECFSPIPRVDSAVIYLKKLETPMKLEQRFITAIFQHKNQSIKNALLHSCKFLSIEKNKIQKFISSLKEEKRKVRSLTPFELSSLSILFQDFFE